MTRKVHRGLFGLKASGAFSATSSTFQVVDHHLDVVLAGSMPRGQVVRISSWNHDLDGPAAGEATLHADEQQAWVVGKLFLDRPEGRETYNRLKALGSSAEFSYAFAVIDGETVAYDELAVRLLRRLAVFEASAVDRAASLGTGLRSLKSAAGTVVGWTWRDDRRVLVGPDGQQIGPFVPLDARAPAPPKRADPVLAAFERHGVRCRIEQLERQERQLSELAAQRDAFYRRHGRVELPPTRRGDRGIKR